MTEFILGIWTPLSTDLDTDVGEDGVEHAGELAVTVPDEEPRPAAGILQIHDEVPGRLDDPRRSRMRGCSQDPDPAGGVLDDRQHEQAGAAYGDGLEEVAGEQRVSLGAEETGPGGRMPGRARGRSRPGGGSPTPWRRRP